MSFILYTKSKGLFSFLQEKRDLKVIYAYEVSIVQQMHRGAARVTKGSFPVKRFLKLENMKSF